jgi:formylglycine-generating enzyme
MLGKKSFALTMAALGLVGCSLLTTIDDDVSSGNAATTNEGGTTEGGAVTPNDGGDSGNNNPTVGCKGTEGPKQVRVDVPSAVGGHYCIDSTEVTARDYLKFLSSTTPSTTNPQCTGLKPGPAAFTPGGGWPPVGADLDFPVTEVDWCDAEAYCKWAGKKLCGSYTSEPLTFNSGGNYDRSILAHACSGGGKTKYPFGDTYVPGKCRDNNDQGGAVKVGTLPECEGGFPGIFDLAGNVAEWMDACNNNGTGDRCLAFNSPYYETMPLELVCSYTRTDINRGDRHGYIGFRCCGD